MLKKFPLDQSLLKMLNLGIFKTNAIYYTWMASQKNPQHVINLQYFKDYKFSQILQSTLIPTTISRKTKMSNSYFMSITEVAFRLVINIFLQNIFSSGLLIGCKKNGNYVIFHGKLCDKKGLLCGKLCKLCIFLVLFYAGMILRFQRKATTFVLFKWQLEHKGEIVYAYL